MDVSLDHGLALDLSISNESMSLLFVFGGLFVVKINFAYINRSVRAISRTAPSPESRYLHSARLHRRRVRLQLQHHNKVLAPSHLHRNTQDGLLTNMGLDRQWRLTHQRH